MVPFRKFLKELNQPAMQLLDPLPVGLIVDSPWLPGWAGVSMLDYFADGFH